MIDAETLSRLAGVSRRTLKYVIARGIVPSVSAEGNGRGNRRTFTQRQAQLLAIASRLHDTGIRGPVVAKIIRACPGKLDATKPLRIVLGPIATITLDPEVYNKIS